MRNVKDLHPRLQEKIGELKFRCKQQGISIGIGECVRTVAEQDALYAQGRTEPGNIVTNAKGTTYSSQHQWGIAFDFYLDMDVDGDGQKSDDAFNNSTALFEKVGKIAKSIGLGWGGDWISIKDRPHLYLPDWGSTASKLKAQYGTPEAFKKTWEDQEVESPVKTEPAKTEPVKTSSGNDTVKLGQIHANNFTNSGIAEDGIRGANTKKTGIKVLQRGLNMDYAAGLVEDGIYGSRTANALDSRTIRKGDKGCMVTALEILLMLKGYNPGGLEYPGVFGDNLNTALRQYQKDYGLNVDGIAGIKTFKSLIS